MPTYRSPRPTLPPDTALAHALPELRTAELRLRKNAAQHGITYVIAEFGGLRSPSDTTKALDYRAAEYPGYVKAMQAAGKTPLSMQQWRPIQPYGNSYHNYGAAFDVFVTSVPEGRTQQWGYDMLALAATAAGLRNGASFNDLPHFELPVKLADAKVMWQKFTGSVAVVPTSQKSGSSTFVIVAGVGAVALLLALAFKIKSPSS